MILRPITSSNTERKKERKKALFENNFVTRIGDILHIDKMDFITIMPFRAICSATLLSAPLAALGICIATIAAPGPRSYALIAISFVVALTLGVAFYLHYRNSCLVEKSTDEYRKIQKILYDVFRPSCINITLLYSSILIHAIIIMVRIDATDIFGGHKQNLDFGIRSTGDESNIAMTNVATTYGHFLQGFLASFLSFPAVVGLLARLPNSYLNRELYANPNSTNTPSSSRYSVLLGSSPKFSIIIFLQLAAACMTIYPSYSGIKRLIKSSESFSRTSHLNNVTEWLLGSLLGIGIGWSTTVSIQCYLIKLGGMNVRNSFSVVFGCGKDSDERERNDESKLPLVMSMLEVEEGSTSRRYGFGKANEYECINTATTSSKVVSIISAILLIVYSIGTVLSGVFIGMTWNYGIKESPVDQNKIAGFVGIYVLITVAMALLGARKWPFHTLQ